MLNNSLAYGLQPGLSPIAVIVFHGIGEQAPFETLNGVVEAFVRAHVREHGQEWRVHRIAVAEGDQPVEGGAVKFVKLDGHPETMLPLAELELEHSTEGIVQQFHFYEVYWAPMTEGVVRFLDVLLFLLKAGWDGASAQIRRRKFIRFTFGKQHEYGILTLTAVQLMLAFFVVVALVVLSCSFFAVVGTDILTHFRFNAGAHWPVGPVRRTIVSFMLSTALLTLPAILNAWLQRKRGDTTSKSASIMNFLSIAPLLACIGWFGIAIIWALVTWNAGWGVWWPEAIVSSIPRQLRWITFVVVGIFIISKFYLFLVKSVGDITAYVSAHAVNRFWQTREAIQARAIDVGRTIYVRTKDRSAEPPPYYENIVLVSHSLGSVVAYDMLNSLINFEIKECADDLKRVAERTRLFLTCGSPLNKISFLFRFQTGTGAVPRWRELLNNYRQPLILEHDKQHRPQRWINISCFADWISGRLLYYELPAHGPRKRPTPREAFTNYVIDERSDTDGIIPLAAHTQYFGHAVFRTAIYEALWAEFPDDDAAAANTGNRRSVSLER